MRVAIIYTTKSPATSLVQEVARGIDEAISARDHNVTLVDIATNSDMKITLYDYIIVIGQPQSFFSKRLSPEINQYLSNSGSLIGKRGSVVLVKRGLFAGKSLSILMRATEHEGVYLKNSTILSKQSEAKSFGSHLQL